MFRMCTAKGQTFSAHLFCHSPKKDVCCVLWDDEGCVDAEQGREIDTKTEMMKKLTGEEGEEGNDEAITWDRD